MTTTLRKRTPIKVNVSLDAEILARADYAAKRLGVTRSALVDHALEALLETRDLTPPTTPTLNGGAR